MTQTDNDLRDNFRFAMQRLAASVCVLTGAHNGERRGLTATAVCSLTAEPPAVLACVNRNVGAHDMILDSGVIGVNILSMPQRPVAESFAGMTGASGEARFDAGDWFTARTGAPLLRGALAALDCRIERTIPFHTHTVLFCLVEDVALADDIGPLLYGARAFRNLGETLGRPHVPGRQDCDFDAYAGLPIGWP